MRYLLDTNILIILYEKNTQRLSTAQREVLADPVNTYCVSDASLYEIAIKVRGGKKEFSHVNLSDIERIRKQLGIRLLRLRKSHYESILNVPSVKKKDGKPHADPFDLLILAQAQAENLPVLSTDEYFPQYDKIKVIA